MNQTFLLVDIAFLTGICNMVKFVARFAYTFRCKFIHLNKFKAFTLNTLRFTGTNFLKKIELF